MQVNFFLAGTKRFSKKLLVMLPVFSRKLSVFISFLWRLAEIHIFKLVIIITMFVAVHQVRAPFVWHLYHRTTDLMDWFWQFKRFNNSNNNEGLYGAESQNRIELSIFYIFMKHLNCALHSLHIWEEFKLCFTFFTYLGSSWIVIFSKVHQVRTWPI